MVKQADYLFDASEIVAHMFFSTGDTDEVRITHARGEFTGTFRYPISEVIEIVHPGGFLGLQQGDAVYISHPGMEGEQYRFHSEVVSVESGLVRICIPYAIERSDRRLTVRVPVPADAGIQFELKHGAETVPCRVRDLSDGGLSFIDPTESHFAVGQVVYGTLTLPEREPIRMGIEIRHDCGAPGAHIYGGRMVAISLAERGRLSRFLVEGPLAA